MSFNVGDTVAIWNRYYRAWQKLSDRPFDVAGLQTTFGIILGRAPDDPTLYAPDTLRTATGEAVWSPGSADGLRRVYFDSHGDGTGTSAALYLVRVRDITSPVGSGSDRVYPETDLIAPSADVFMPATAHFRQQTVTTSRSDNA